MTENAPQNNDHSDLFSKPGPVNEQDFINAVQALWESDDPTAIGENEGGNDDIKLSEPPVADNVEESEDEPASLGDLEVPVRAHVGDDDYSDAKTIPKKRLNKEIEKRKVLEEQLSREREERIKAQHELQLYSGAVNKMSAPQEARKEEIDPVDQDAHNYYMRELNALKYQISQQENQLKQSTELNNFANAVNSQQAEFSRQMPDFDKAYDFLLEKEQQNAVLQGINDDQAERYVREKLYNMSHVALSNGRNVPEMIYELSKNMGYSAKQAPKAASIATLARNQRASADATREVSSVSAKLGRPDGPAIPLKDFERLAMNEGGRGVNETEFHRQLAILQKSMNEA
jgi:hypothetical protein